MMNQLFHNTWLEELWKLRKPKIFTGWYCKKWIDNFDYWKGSSISWSDCHTKKNTHIIDVDYVGTGGCLIDSSIFLSTSPIWTIPNNLPEKRITL